MLLHDITKHYEHKLKLGQAKPKGSREEGVGETTRDGGRGSLQIETGQLSVFNQNIIITWNNSFPSVRRLAMVNIHVSPVYMRSM